MPRKIKTKPVNGPDALVAFVVVEQDGRFAITTAALHRPRPS